MFEQCHNTAPMSLSRVLPNRGSYFAFYLFFWLLIFLFLKFCPHQMVISCFFPFLTFINLVLSLSCKWQAQSSHSTSYRKNAWSRSAVSLINLNVFYFSKDTDCLYKRPSIIYFTWNLHIFQWCLEYLLLRITANKLSS